MQPSYDPRFPSLEGLRARARQRIPKFAFEYLDGGCNEDVNLRRNRQDLQRVELEPRYIVDEFTPSLETELFGRTYAAPFGIAPIGLQGLIWPDAPRILAEAAHARNLPFVLSTVSTASIEEIGRVTDGQFWFQLYHPADPGVRGDILRRAREAGCQVLMALADVPSFGFRPRDIRNGLAMPPRPSLRNLWEIGSRPAWAWATLRHGKPRFASLEPYMPGDLDLRQLGRFMNETFVGRLTRDRLAELRDLWKGTLILKGAVSEADVEAALELGVDGILVSNHGGRQLDAGQSSIVPMTRLARAYGERLTVMLDSGIRSGPDVARAVARGARFTFLGRSFMYGVGALGSRGGVHTIELLRAQLTQVLDQLGCRRVGDLHEHLAPDETEA